MLNHRKMSSAIVPLEQSEPSSGPWFRYTWRTMRTLELSVLPLGISILFQPWNYRSKPLGVENIQNHDNGCRDPTLRVKVLRNHGGINPQGVYVSDPELTKPGYRRTLVILWNTEKQKQFIKSKISSNQNDVMLLWGIFLMSN